MTGENSRPKSQLGKKPEGHKSVVNSEDEEVPAGVQVRKKRKEKKRKAEKPAEDSDSIEDTRTKHKKRKEKKGEKVEEKKEQKLEKVDEEKDDGGEHIPYCRTSRKEFS